MEDFLNRLKQKVEIREQIKQRDDLYFITIKKEQTELVLRYIKDNEKFKHLSFMQAVDYLDDSKFMLIYMLYSFSRKVSLGVSVFIDRKEAIMTSMHNIWPHLWQYQREIKEMYGIDFPSSPRVNEDFILESWDNMPPMRRDFDTLKYSEETYYQRPGRKTNDPKEYMRKKLYNDFVKTPKLRDDK
ncbi:MAG: NADH-quinone oxidoreductase subunit C [Candidatus Cloacimonetes bacterium]|nr:NADH-quinone oxidoreductase subunit C [Candidatus Cloacimonadota bacterium]